MSIVLTATLAVMAMTSNAAAETLDTAKRIVQAYQDRFRVVDASLTRGLEDLYAQDARLKDPITTVEGLDAIRRYLEHFAEQSKSARFEIQGEIVQAGQAAIFWTMVFPSDDDEPGRRLEGVSRLRFHDRIYDQRDYFDLGEAVYSHVPFLSWLTELVNRRLALEVEPSND